MNTICFFRSRIGGKDSGSLLTRKKGFLCRVSANLAMRTPDLHMSEKPCHLEFLKMVSGIAFQGIHFDHMVGVVA
jgi:hypothetical protein